jgi:hypothetical protein
MRWLRAAVLVAATLAVVEPAHADDAVAKYRGQIVISPDAPPTIAGELPAYLAANATKDHHYALTKGPPWDIHLVGVLARDTSRLTLVFIDKADGRTVDSFEVSAKRQLAIAHVRATTEAGYVAGKRYILKMKVTDVVLASAELELRD